MKTHTVNKDGFGIIEIMVVLVIATALVLGGWYVWNQKMQLQSQGSQNHTGGAGSSASTATLAPPSSPTPAPSSTYLHIRELGLRITLPEDLKDVVYQSYNQGLSTNGEAVLLSTQTITGKDAGCGVDGGAPPLGRLFKLKTPHVDPSGQDGPLTPNGVDTFKLGGYYVYLQHPQATCTDKSDVQTLAKKQYNEFHDALTTVQLDQ